MDKSSGLTYRKDIDGLRGIAIIFVLLYHLGIHFLPSGFVGVDVFFVISGFLISSIIFEHLHAQDFSWGLFYRRRIRRLLPALFAFYACTSIAACFILYPHDLSAFGRSLAAAALFCANFFFLAQSNDYFAADSDLAPLQHMWSLAVEEQYYLIFPLLALLVFRFAYGARKVIFWVLAVLSFGLCLGLTFYDRQMAFYLLPTRFWELLLGSLLALEAVPDLKNKKLREGMAALGLALIVIAGLLTKKIPFPGYIALLPCLGAAVLIHSGRQRDTLVYRLLCTRGLAFVGLISYSLYLWHFPFISFYKWLWLEHRLPLAAALPIAVLSVLVACLCYFCLERPLRLRWPEISNARVFAAAGVSGCVLLSIAAAFVFSGGLKARYSPQVLHYADFDPQLWSKDCFITQGHYYLAPSCLSLSSTQKNILVYGDSHAAHLRQGLQNVYTDVHFLEASASGCPPSWHRGKLQQCKLLEDQILGAFLPEHKVDAIIVSSNWTGYMPTLIEFIEHIRAFNHNIIVIGPIVEYQVDLPLLLTKSLERHDAGLVERAQLANRFSIDQIMAQGLAGSGVHYLSLIQLMCQDTHCLHLDDSGAPLQFDRDHLTLPGAETIARDLQPQLAPLLEGDLDIRAR